MVFNLGFADPKRYANEFKRATRAKGSVRGLQYRCSLIINVFLKIIFL